MSNIIVKTSGGAQLNWDTATGPLSLSEVGSTPPPDPGGGGGNQLPTPGPGEIVLPNQAGVSGGVVTYPSTNQQYKSQGLSTQTLLVPWMMPANVPTDRPNNIGSFNTAEVPGQLRVARALEVSVNNVVKIPWPPPGQNNTGPAFYFTVGNPTGYQNVGAQVNFQPGDAVAVRLKNPNGEASNVLIALTPPPTY